jgi:hypothetical protein
MEIIEHCQWSDKNSSIEQKLTTKRSKVKEAKDNFT